MPAICFGIVDLLFHKQSVQGVLRGSTHHLKSIHMSFKASNTIAKTGLAALAVSSLAVAWHARISLTSLTFWVRTLVEVLPQQAAALGLGARGLGLTLLDSARTDEFA